MKKITLILTLILFTMMLTAEWINIPENSKKNIFEHVRGENEAIEISFALNGFEMEEISEREEIFQKISYFNEGEFLEIGKPDLPRFTRLVAIPNEGTVSIDIISSDYDVLTDMNIYPRQELLSESQPNRNEFVIDDDYYANGDIFPGTIAEIGTPAIMRDYRVVTVTVNPFQYDPKTQELKLYKNINIVVNCTGKGGENPKFMTQKKSRSFEQLYSSTIINHESLITRDDEYQDPSYLFIYTTSTSVETYLDLLVDWKHQKGFEVTATDFSSGTSSSTIKSYIQTAYDTWENPPEFVCLVGDAGGSFNIPTWPYYAGEGDQNYARLDGGDILADVFIGRLSFNYIDELATIVYKILNYEKEPYMTDTDWYNKALLVGDPSSSGQSCIITKKNVKEMIDRNETGFTYDEIYYGSCASEMNSSMNDGVLYFNYRGYLGMSGWGTDDISSLTNGYMLPVSVFPTCGSGDFEGTSDCRSEAMLKAGSVAVPKGGIAAIGTATMYTHTCFNNCVDAGIFYGIFQDQIYHMGGALNRGKLNLYLNYPQNPNDEVNNFSYWNNLMGDPGMEIWTNLPEDLIVTYDSTIPLGSNFIEVTVENSSRTPLEGAWVTALMGDDEIFSTGYTDSNGQIFLQFDGDTEGTVTLTVTNHNYIPHLGSFDIGQENKFLSVFETNIDDDNFGTSSGNSDGNINPGEDIELGVSLKNYGTSSTYSIGATISSDDSFIAITDNSETYPNIGAGSSSYSTDDFDFSLDADVLGGTEIDIDIVITEGVGNVWNDKIYLTVDGANLSYDSYTVVDGGNGILDPGETSDLTITLENIGSVSSSSVYGTLSSSDSQITVPDHAGYFGTIGSGSSATNNSNKFEVSASSNIAPGTQFTLDLQLYNASGYDNTVQFIFEVGDVSVTDPLGPDTYGYYCYDDGDITYTPTPIYDWEEIDPNYGGSGTVITMSDVGNTGDIETISLPFNFPFYGENYSTITVCSNGWIAPGSTEQYSFMNWHIPGPLGPSPMIAPFWDDLKIGSGRVCYYNNSGQHYFIVEWSHLQNEYNSAEETFQVILYDPNYYPTPTGDGEIKMQYKVVNNVDVGDYTPTFHISHGQYATVGIEDHTSEVGLEYTYNNTYPTAAKTLQNQMAILYTTNSPEPPSEPYLVIGTIVIDDTNGNGNVDYGETVNLEIDLNNMGLNPATGVSAILSSTDSYVTVTQNSSNYSDIAGGTSGTNFTDYTFTVDNDCPDGHNAIFDLDVTGNEDTWDLDFQLMLNAPVVEFQEVFVNDGGNNTLDPDETTELRVTLINNGGADVTNLNSILSSTDSYITINDNYDNVSTLQASSTANVYYNVTTSVNTPLGHTVIFALDFTGDLGYSNTDGFALSVGLNVEDFETGDFSKYAWEFDGDADWIIDSDSYEGTYSAQSDDITDNEDVSLVIEVNVLSAGDISFWKKVSCENHQDNIWDYLRFRIDGVEQERWSGIIDWSEETYPVSAGTRTFEWHYHKDGSVSEGEDCAWVDYIIFPPLASPAQITYSPASYTKTLAPDDSTTDDLNIGNDGGTTLDYTATVVYTTRIANIGNNKFDISRIRSENNVGDREIKTPIVAPFFKEVDQSLRLCQFTIDLVDDYGDGWNGGSVDVLVNGSVVLNDLSLSSGYGPESHSFDVNTGDQISTNYSAGSWSYENAYYIYDNDGTQVASDGVGGSTPTGLSPFTATCTNDPTFDWCTLDGANQVTGSIDTGSPNDVITVTFDTNPDDLGVGTYEANIVITSNDPDNSQVIIPVTLNVEESLDPPVNVTIAQSGSNITINWNSVTGANSYKIYSDSNPYGSFSTLEEEGINVTSWQTAASAASKFYRVVASTDTPMRKSFKNSNLNRK